MPDTPVPWLKVGDKLPACSFGPFEPAHLRAYTAASGDDNPIHLDEAMARSIGLAGAPVHGMLVMSCFQPALAAWRGDLRLLRLNGKFAMPLICGESVEISGRVVQVSEGDGPQAIMRLMAHSERRALTVLAEATLAPREGNPS